MAREGGNDASQEVIDPTERAVRAEQVRTAFRLGVGVLVVNPLNAAIVAAMVWSSTAKVALIVWVAAMAAVAAARANLRSRYLRAAPGVDQTSVWSRRFVVGAAAAGVMWGVGGAAFYDPTTVATQLLLIFVVGGMVAGASGTLASHLPAFFAYVGGAILPLTARLFAQGDAMHVGMGALALVYSAAMAAVAYNNHRAVSEAFRLRFERHELLERLSSAQVSLAEINRTLEERVAERSAALERQTETLLEAQRMESVGLLAGGVAHDFNNLLTVMLGNVEILLSGPRLDVEQRLALEEIRRASNRGAGLVSQLLTFSRRRVVVRAEVDLNDVVAEARRLLGRVLGEHVELVVELRAGRLPVRADASQLQQVIINLATNARDAMTDGGTLRIETELVEGAEAGAPVRPGPHVVLTVRDTGVGMDAETRRMAFHPFFTTKEVGRGAGLGLATVYGIVEECGGHVLVESTPGRGSCFRVFLPYSGPPEFEARGPRPEAP